MRASIEYLLMAVAGGLGQLSGALVGSALVLLMKNGLQDVLPLLSQRAGQLEAVAFAVLFILLLHYARGGLMGFVARWSRGRFGAPRGRRRARRRRPSRCRAAPLPERGTRILAVRARSSASAGWSRSTTSASTSMPARSSA